MLWVRANRGRGAGLALAAMMLQIVLSFGHVHVENLTTSSNGVSVAAPKASSSQHDPAGHPANDADDYCAICAAIHLASSSFLPGALVLPVPFAFRRAEHFHHFTFISILPQRVAFQSRAPPLA
jgi:hypothetical protein